MKIGVTSQNLRTVTGHASNARSFLMYEWTAEQALQPVEPLAGVMPWAGKRA